MPNCEKLNWFDKCRRLEDDEEIVANHDLKAKEVQGGQDERNQQIVDAAAESGKKVRKLFPW
ncbi:MAG: hypothetical protein J7647_05620 [Cyanobacteria bacterium SBLK]|nr:hypothetical protein [Cyanobacteria bacterium SBLK]